MQATVWTGTDCPRCEAVVNRLKERGAAVEVRDAEDLQNGVDADREALAQLAMQDMALPVVRQGESFLSESQIDALLN